MNFKELVKDLFGEAAKNEKFAEARTATGQTIEAESFEPGNAVFLRTSEGDLIPLPEGEYELEDGSRIMVNAEGTIAEFSPASSDEEMDKAQQPEAQEMETEEATSEEPKKVIEEVKTTVEFATVEQLEAMKNEILAGLEVFKSELNTVKAEKVEMSETAKAELEQLKKKVHQPAELGIEKEEKQVYESKLPGTRGAKFVNPTLSRVRANNLKIANS
ncbi:MAG: hypothetical protein HRU18_27575 [Pseudoalteromonas sp.]|uniref:hypothetical protein n=1 Tax=Pseudoalteromonas sp. TaxID=53249 RepID=UPI001D797D40|nr:hypothetical protein [Pseudoalteromonas sp.]NRA81974.1 hypothetical protein [Pseudoalteromonas sp.]